MNLLIILIWSMAMLAGYFYFHKPISPAQAISLVSAFLDLGIATLVLAVAGGLGRRLLRAVNLDALQRLAVGAAAGLGILSLVWLGLGSLGLIYVWSAWLLLLLLVVLLRKEVLGWLRDLGALSRLWKESRSFERLLAVACTLLLAFQLVIALAPPLKWDALTYHLALPQQYIAAHATVLNPANPYAGEPQLVEMLYTWAMQLLRPETAAVLGWEVGVICLLGIFGLTTLLAQLLAERLQKPQIADSAGVAGWMAVTAVLVGLTFRQMLSWSYSDIFSALFGAASLILLFTWLRGGPNRLWFWLAALGAWAVSIKWTSGVLILAVFASPLILRRQRTLPLATWVGAAAAAVAVYAPWLIRDLLATGNPIYPMLFPTAQFSAWRLAAANLPPQGLTWLSGLALPVSLTWSGVDSAAGFSTDIGPLLVLLAIPGLWQYRKSREVWVLALLLGITWAAIATLGLRFGHLTQPRLYFAALPALAVLAGLGWAHLQTLVVSGVRLKRILGTLIALVCALVVAQDLAALNASGAPAVVLGGETGEQYLAANLGDYAALGNALSTLPSGSQTLALWEPRGFYLPATVKADYWIDAWRAEMQKTPDPGAAVKEWKAQGITHLVVYAPGEEYMRQSDPATSPAAWAALDRLLRQLPTPQTVGETYRIYTLP